MFTAVCYVTVVVPVVSVSLNQTAISLEVGSSATIIASVLPEDATNKKVTWKTSNTSIATVDQDGKVTAKAVGSATITAVTSDGNKSATCSVNVTPQESEREGYGSATWWSNL